MHYDWFWHEYSTKMNLLILQFYTVIAKTVQNIIINGPPQLKNDFENPRYKTVINDYFI